MKYKDSYKNFTDINSEKNKNKLSRDIGENHE
jgi:hypothetical protein